MKEKKKGTYLIILAYVLWGVLPLYWQQLNGVKSLEIIAYRILLSLIICFIILVIKQELYIFNIFKNKKEISKYILISLLLFINWSTFIYAVTNNLIIDAGMGYYLTPLVSVVLGIVFLKEKLNKSQTIAFVLALIGIIYYIISIGVFPYIALILAFSFSIYGLFKKKIKISGIHSMTIETALLTPIALIILFVIDKSGNISLFYSSNREVLLILLAGVITLTPLVLFAEGTKRIPLIRVGFLQFIGPTLMLLMGLIMGEKFSYNQIIAFSFIWISLIIYSISISRSNINDRKNSNRITTKKE